MVVDGPAADGSAEDAAEDVEAFGNDPVPDPQPALLPLDEAGLEQDLSCGGADRRLRATRRLGEVAGAHLVGAAGRDVREEAEAYGVGQRGERASDVASCSSSTAERSGGQQTEESATGMAAVRAMPTN